MTESSPSNTGDGEQQQQQQRQELLLSPSNFHHHHRHHQSHSHPQHHLSSPWNATPPRRLLTSTATASEHHLAVSRTITSPEPPSQIQAQQQQPLSHYAFRNYGLLITLTTTTKKSQLQQDGESHAPTTTNNSRLQFQFCPDHNFRDIHPNAYAPADFCDDGDGVQALAGGGSGVAVFGGHHPHLGDTVMKHGNDQDLGELVSLATVARELQDRGCAEEGDDRDDAPLLLPAAARHLQYRIPEFRFIYISPHHLGEKRKELWKRLRYLRDTTTSRNNNNDNTMAAENDPSNNKCPQERSAKSRNDSSYGYSVAAASSTVLLLPIEEEDSDDSASSTPTSSPTSSTGNSSDSVKENHNENPPPPVPVLNRHLHHKLAVEEDEEADADEEGQAEENFQLLKHASQESLLLKSNSDESNVTSNNAENNNKKGGGRHPHRHLPPGVEISQSGTITGHRDIALVAMDPQNDSKTSRSNSDKPNKKCSISLQGDTLTFVLLEGQYDFFDENDNNNMESTPENNCSGRVELHGDGYEALEAITQDLIDLMKEHRWKFTFGQKQIGKYVDDMDSSRNGNQYNPFMPKPQYPIPVHTGNIWLYQQQLKGHLLQHLITQKIGLVRDLVRLTTAEEQDANVLDEIRQEVATLVTSKSNSNITAQDMTQTVSEQADAFLGNAIKKNFKSETGRFALLKKLGAHFRDHHDQQPQSFLEVPGGSFKNGVGYQYSFSAGLILTREEVIPAKHLGNLTKADALLGDTFQDAPMEPLVFGRLTTHYWQVLLSQAVGLSEQNGGMGACSSKDHNMVYKRLWTAGLADAGLHNLFLSQTRIWFFDLGEPQLASVPGFLTKFLFSFFHTLGMEERQDTAGGGHWARRFEANEQTQKLCLTKDTSNLLSEAYAGFQLTLDRFIKELFDGDNSVRWLLVQYVTLQLLSDASFCLQKWTIKVCPSLLTNPFLSTLFYVIASLTFSSLPFPFSR